MIERHKEKYIAALDAAEQRIAELSQECDALRAEVQEWLCAACRTVFPGPPQPGFKCIICPKCGGETGPRGAIELDEARTQLTIRTNAIEGPQGWRDEYNRMKAERDAERERANKAEVVARGLREVSRIALDHVAGHHCEECTELLNLDSVRALLAAGEEHQLTREEQSNS